MLNNADLRNTFFTLTFLGLAFPNYLIDEGCCLRHIEEQNCIDHCKSVIGDEKVTSFTPENFACAPSQETNKLTKCVERSNYGLPIDREVCCDKAQTKVCKKACGIGTPRNDFSNKCDRSTETDLYSCISDYIDMKECCYSTSIAFQCAAACNHAQENGPELSNWVDILKHCTDDYPSVNQCIIRKIGDDSQNRYDCCKKSSNATCRYICGKALSRPYSQAEQIAALFDVCGDPIKDETWLCFMSEPSAGISPLGELTAIQCCKKAVSTECRNRCLGMYKNWLSTDLWDEFGMKCRYNPSEEMMVNCILDVSEPCTLGCDHLTFCSNLNNRPLDMFRTCSPTYDNGAEHDYTSWVATGFIQTPLVNITVKNVTTCHPEDWKAISCILQTKPCHKKSHSNSICKDACVKLLNACLDHSRSHRTVEEICAILAPINDPEYCLDLAYYSKPGDDGYNGELTHPCQPSPCKPEQQCVLNRNCRIEDSHCSIFICQDSCSIGAARDWHVELGTWVRIPIEDEEGCYKVCTCDTTRKLSGCNNLQCPPNDDCKVAGFHYAHLTQFTIECNTCVCYGGHVTCTKRECGSWSGYSVPSSAAPPLSLPGRCGLYYSPVCSSSGVRYPNACVASKFVILESSFHYSSCELVDVCRNKPCPDDKVCRIQRQTCVDHRAPCPQYTCELPTINCEGEDLEPVCDTQNVQHPHMCSLIQHQRDLAYKGYCIGSCNGTSGVVCGANGRTYSSSCVADSEYMTVDYAGPCKPPSDTDFSKGLFCAADTVCSPLPDGCEGIKLPDMCCPICAAVVSLLPSQMLVHINDMYNIETKLTVKLLCKKLNALLSLSQCKVSCKMGLFGDIEAVVATTKDRPSAIHVEACNNEAFRIETFIALRNVRIDSDLVLSTILGATAYTSNFNKANTASDVIYSFHILFSYIFIVLVFKHV